MQYPAWKYPIHWLAHGFGLGLAPFAPGTFGSLLGIVLFWVMHTLSPTIYLSIVAVLFFAGIFICGQTARDVGATDPGFIVFDEVVGFLVAMFLMPFDWRWICAGFLIFRLFDIWKPFPISWIEDRLGIGSGIMSDDIIAGIYTSGILFLAGLGLKALST